MIEIGKGGGEWTLIEDAPRVHIPSIPLAAPTTLCRVVGLIGLQSSLYMAGTLVINHLEEANYVSSTETCQRGHGERS